MYEKLYTLMKERNMTASQLSRETGIPTSTISEWKKGQYTPKIDKLQKLSAYFNIPISYFTEKNSSISAIYSEENVNEQKKIPIELKKLLENEEVAINGHLLSKKEKEMMVRIIEAIFCEIKGNIKNNK